MALIICPECGREISSTAESCPQCGFVLVKNELPKIRTTPLGEPEKKPGSGTLMIVCGIVAVIVGVFTIAFVIGIFAVIGGFVFITMGVNSTKGTQTGTCPYCNNAVTVPVSSKTFKCPECKKTSAKIQTELHTID